MKLNAKVRIGKEYEDASGRLLVVDEYRPRAQDGRQVVGRLRSHPDAEPVPYSGDAEQFEEVWVLRQAPRTVAQQEAARKGLGV